MASIAPVSGVPLLFGCRFSIGTPPPYLLGILHTLQKEGRGDSCLGVRARVRNMLTMSRSERAGPLQVISFLRSFGIIVLIGKYYYIHSDRMESAMCGVDDNNKIHAARFPKALATREEESTLRAALAQALDIDDAESREEDPDDDALPPDTVVSQASLPAVVPPTRQLVSVAELEEERARVQANLNAARELERARVDGVAKAREAATAAVERTRVAYVAVQTATEALRLARAQARQAQQSAAAAQSTADRLSSESSGVEGDIREYAYQLQRIERAVTVRKAMDEDLADLLYKA